MAPESKATGYVLPAGAEERKQIPIFSGVLNYFPLALAAVARVSKRGNDQHNPGKPLHWSRDKSQDHLDCVGRHLLDVASRNEAGEYPDAEALAWRALAHLQLLEEARLGKPISRGSSAGSECAADPTIHVVVGVMRRGRKVYLQRRAPSDENFPGAWECPGGGVKPGESDQQALARELREELGVEVKEHEIVTVPIWRGQIQGYKGGRHDFRFYEVIDWVGKPARMDGQPESAWVSMDRPPMGLTPANLLAWPDVLRYFAKAK